MRPVGGLKLALSAARRDDRRLRFVSLRLAAAGSQEEIRLVTDSCGRLRYRLPAGDYRLRLTDGRETRFEVADNRWTSLRVQLP